MDGKRNGNQKSRRSKATAVGWEIESFENRECLVRINPSSDLNVYLPMAEIPLVLEPETLDLASHNDPFFSRWGNPFLTRQSQRMCHRVRGGAQRNPALWMEISSLKCNKPLLGRSNSGLW